MSRTYKTILLSRKGPVARITLNRPDKRNPISPLVAGELVHAFRAASEDEQVRVVVLTGAGKVFSAGGDLSSMAQATAGDGPVIDPVSLVELFETMHKLGKPLICMVNGHALAGGLGLMVACDIVVASDAATFGTTEIRVGLWPMMVTAELSRNIGRKRALEMMLTGRRLDAAEALDIGLVTKVVPHGELEAAIAELVAKLAENSPATTALGLQAFYRCQDMSHGEGLRFLEGQLGKVLALEDAREGLMAFLQKRKPVWKGR